MYKHILVPLENTPTDAVILAHVRELARHLNSRLTLIHVADGFQARHQKQLGESEEMRRDRAYLDKREQELRDDGFAAGAILTWGEPAARIIEAAESNHCDLIAMATHGHRLFGDLVFGTVASDVRHRTRIPVLLIKA
ncbi:MAG: universal stress protein [Candidatus Zixiibacteriota bacterium]